MQLIISIVGFLAFGSYAAAYVPQLPDAVLLCDHGWANIQASCANKKNMYCCLPQGGVDATLNIHRKDCETPIGLEFQCGHGPNPTAGVPKCCP
ncbi:hypothetical protein LZ554_000248 [Drepanopeziza brunnea f. sp. 'monogermtubi']|nr:hypothetical protein LZ554_000248 [Drepanopeziza brunnea f. sp. 'monogermtubi']